MHARKLPIVLCLPQQTFVGELHLYYILINEYKLIFFYCQYDDMIVIIYEFFYNVGNVLYSLFSIFIFNFDAFR